MTFIAASIAVHEVQKVSVGLERAVNAAAMGANLIEWRVDQLADEPDSLKAIKRLVRECPRPCIVTCRPAGVEGGEYEGDENSRLEMFEALAESDDPPRYIDIELSNFHRDPQRIRALAERSNSDRRTSLIFSTHDFVNRPADLLQRIEAMTHETSCAVMKVAWMARSLRDNLEAFELLRARQKPMIALCMGRFGWMSRVLSGKFGGFLTFASDSVTEVTAPGQPVIDELRKMYRFDRINSKTRVYGVIGWPVEHSLSPAFHNAGFDAIGFDGVYLPLPIPPEYEHFKATVGALIDHQVLDFRGASVTIPHKENLIRFVKERGGRCDALCERIGAANTLIVGIAPGCGLECLNTDCPAAVTALCEAMGIAPQELQSMRIAVLGAGGAARAIVVGLLEFGTRIVIFNRNVARASRLASDLACLVAPPAKGSLSVGDSSSLAREQFDIYINCTPLGMTGSGREVESPLPPDAPLDERTTVFDTVYVPVLTLLLTQAKARGAKIVSGTEMFRIQASMQFEKWTGKPAHAQKISP